MTNIATSPITPEAWRNHSTKHPIAASRLKRGDLRRLYKIINDQQFEYRDRFMPVIIQLPNESLVDFEARRKRVFDAFITSMTINSADGEMLHGNNESFLDETNLPDHIKSIFFSTANVPRGVLNISPMCSITLFIDFTTPPLLDFGRLPTLPTPNESNYEVAADNHSWFAATTAKLGAFFRERKTDIDWLHRSAIYDVLLFFAGLPIAICVSYRLSQVLSTQLPQLISSAILVYAFLGSLMVFRLLFSYARWVFPKVELDVQSKSSPLRHRATWTAINCSLAAALIYEAVRLLL